MIEFKGECGHLIKARDEDVGKIVRCSYCGGESLVAPPAGAGDDFGGLLNEVERTGEYDKHATKTLRKQHRAKKKAAAIEAGATDPVEVIKKMIYVAMAIVAIAIAWSYAVKVIRSLPDSDHRIAGSAGSETTPTPSPTAAPSGAGMRGLLTTRLDAQQQGVYVTSVPANCDIYIMDNWDERSSIINAPSADYNTRTNAAIRLPDGRRFVAVAIRLNHSELMNMPDYPQLRRRIERDDYTIADLEAFFVRDGSVATRVDDRNGSKYLVRVFDVRVSSRLWQQVTALFLPDCPIESLVKKLPARVNYGFNEADVKRELAFYQVDAKDHDAIIKALHRIGLVTYDPLDGSSARSFRIDLDSGALTSVALSN